MLRTHGVWQARRKHVKQESSRDILVRRNHGLFTRAENTESAQAKPEEPSDRNQPKGRRSVRHQIAREATRDRHGERARVSICFVLFCLLRHAAKAKSVLSILSSMFKRANSQRGPSFHHLHAVLSTCSMSVKTHAMSVWVSGQILNHAIYMSGNACPIKLKMRICPHTQDTKQITIC